MIVRNAKDGYPEGRGDRELSLTERVEALCIYAADWKRWCMDAEAASGRWEALCLGKANAQAALNQTRHQHET